jgi:hypothetical protein
LTFDLGYFRYQLFDCIDRNGGYCLTRLAPNANPLMVRAHRTWRGNTLPLEGLRLKLVAGLLKRAVLDVEAEVHFQSRGYRDRRTSKRRCFRLIGVRPPIAVSTVSISPTSRRSCSMPRTSLSSTPRAGKSSWCSRR